MTASRAEYRLRRAEELRETVDVLNGLALDLVLARERA